MKQAITLGYLKKIAEQVGLSDDTEIIVRSDNFELKGSKVGASVSVGKFTKEERNFVDAFDHTPYTKEVYVFDESGETKLCIVG